MNENNNQNNLDSDQEIDLLQLIKELWKRKKFFFKISMIGAVVGILIAYSIPREYVSSARLTPEYTANSAGGLGSLGGLASMVGIGGNGNMAGGDAISTSLYPDVVKSLPFMTDLFSIQVTTDDGELQTSLYEYIDEHQRAPWWGYITALPTKLIRFAFGLFKDKKEASDGGLDGGVDYTALTEDQAKVYNTMKSRIFATVDTKTMVITVTVKMQDPKVAVDITNIVVDNIQAYITNYRTQKAKKDLEYSQKIFKEAKEAYYVAQKNYATFEDENKNITSSRYRTELERLDNEMKLAYSLYTSLANNTAQKALKVQEETPVYAVLDPATKPINNTEPNKPVILIVFVFLSVLGAIVYVIFKDKLIKL